MVLVVVRNSILNEFVELTWRAGPFGCMEPAVYCESQVFDFDWIGFLFPLYIIINEAR